MPDSFFRASGDGAATLQPSSASRGEVARRRPYALASGVVLLVMTTGHCKRERPIHRDDLVTHDLPGTHELPPISLTLPRHARPFAVTDPPSVYMFRERRPVDHAFHVSGAIQPANSRVMGPPDCRLVNSRWKQTSKEQRGPNETAWSCAGDAGARGVLVDRRFDDVPGGRNFYCVAHWRWDGPGDLPAEWKRVAAATEQICDRLKIR